MSCAYTEETGIMAVLLGSLSSPFRHTIILPAGATARRGPDASPPVNRPFPSVSEVAAAYLSTRIEPSLCFYLVWYHRFMIPP